MSTPTTQTTADTCWNHCVARHGEPACMSHRQQCGFPFNQATRAYAGSDEHVACMGAALAGPTDESADAAIRRAAQTCARK